MDVVLTKWLIESLKQCAENSGCTGCAMYKNTAPEICRSALMRLAARRLDVLSSDSY